MDSKPQEDGSSITACPMPLHLLEGPQSTDMACARDLTGLGHALGPTPCSARAADGGLPAGRVLQVYGRQNPGIQRPCDASFAGYTVARTLHSAMVTQFTLWLESLHQRLAALFLALVEKDYVPDVVLRWACRYLITKTRAELPSILAQRRATGEDYQRKLQAFVDELKTMPIAVQTEAANEQHYELPTSYFLKCLGKHLKYSSCLWPTQETTLDGAEEAMLELYCERAKLAEGQEVLELGCGWGSLCLYIAARYPKSRVTAVSNSNSQREFITSAASQRGISNLTVVTANLVDFQPPKSRLTGGSTYDRVVTIECFEHMKNYQELLRRVASWLRPGGLLFVHIFVENGLPYHFLAQHADDWMARYFFSGGTMPSAELLLHFQDDLSIQNQWFVNGKHYSNTLEAWLHRMDAQKASIMPVFEETYGDEAVKWWVRWRLFYISCSEFFGARDGTASGVGHYLFRRK